MSAPTRDAEARRDIAESLGETFVVEAAAGTGKTTALIGRMVAILEAGGARLEEMVAVTFTELAAGEMRLRLRARLEKALAQASDDAVTARLEGALEELEAARIGTIHSFCMEVLGARPVEAGVDPELAIMDEDASRALLERAFDTWFERALETPTECVRRLVRRGGDPRRALFFACVDLAGRRDHPARWERPGFDREARVDALVEEVRSVGALAELASDSRSKLADNLLILLRFARDLDERERARPRDYDGLEAELAALEKDRRWRQHRDFLEFYGPGLLRSDVLTRREALHAKLQDFVRDAGADLAAGLFEDLQPVVEAYGTLKERTGSLDFLDLLIRTRDLLVASPSVRDELRESIRRVFVDEFQDTDPLQAEILLMLSSEGEPPPDGMLADDAPAPVPGKLFLVGDPKQSIYRFRRADVSLYERVCRRLERQGVRRLELSTSFRAPPDIQRVVNAAFAPQMQGAEDGSQARYVALAEHRPAPEGRPSVVALAVPHPYGGWGKVWGGAIERSAPDAVGAFVDWLIRESGWTIEDPLEQRTRRIESRDVCLLFRSTRRYGRSRVAPYLLALEARSIPHVNVGGRASGDREEVLALATVVRAIEHPRDRLAVYATLRGPFFAFSDEALLLHTTNVGPLNPLVPFPDALWDPVRGEVARALEVLRELHYVRNRAPIADTLARFLDATRAHAGVAHWPNGEQALANLLRVLEIARRFERSGAASFRAFVHHLDDRIERGEGIEAPVVEEGADGVRVMTVHKAKGLEFPVVVLCDPSLPRQGDRPSRYVDPIAKRWVAPLAGQMPLELETHREAICAADEAEEVRIGYVAATRARELLVVPCVGDDPARGWVDPLHAGLYPEESMRRKSSDAPGCPEFGEDSAIDRPDQARKNERRAVRPGLHEIGGAGVVWWGPDALGLGKVARGGLRRTSLLSPSADEAAGHRRVEAHLDWVAARDAVKARGEAASWRSRSVTAIAHDAEESAHAPRLEQTDADRDARPGGPRFGTLVHAVLSECPLDSNGAEPTDAELQAMARYQARILDAPDDERAAAVDAARRAFAHPLMARARAAEEVRRECPIAVPMPSGETAEGIVDLAFRDAAGWCVVDFKTDRETGDKVVHSAQLEVYKRAIEAATGLPVETVLFYV